MLTYLRYALATICFAASVGCDPVRTVSQTVRLKVLNAESHSPASGIVIGLKEPFEPRAFTDDSEEWERHQREFWERIPWHTGTSDADGVATVDYAHTALDRSRGKVPPPERDIVSGKTYFVKINDVAMKNQLEMKKASRTELDGFEILVLEVGEPVYRPTE